MIQFGQVSNSHVMSTLSASFRKIGSKLNKLCWWQNQTGVQPVLWIFFCKKLTTFRTSMVRSWCIRINTVILLQLVLFITYHLWRELQVVSACQNNCHILLSSLLPHPGSPSLIHWVWRYKFHCGIPDSGFKRNLRLCPTGNRILGVWISGRSFVYFNFFLLFLITASPFGC